MTDSRPEDSFVQIVNICWKSILWLLIQSVPLFLMPYLLGYNWGLTILIGAYTFIFQYYFAKTAPSERLRGLYKPYGIYAVLAIALQFIWSDTFPSILMGLLLPLYGAACFFGVKLLQEGVKKWCDTPKRWMVATAILFATLCLVKGAGTMWWCKDHGSIEGEKEEILQRQNYLVNEVITSPHEVLNKMPEAIGTQFQGEWALYTCSMLSAAMTNIATVYPEMKEQNLQHIDSLIQIVMSPELRKYDHERWEEDPLTSFDSELSHVSYLSHLAWMISGYKKIGGDKKYDQLFHDLCKTMNRRIVKSPCLNLQTYPGEAIYVPDMLVGIIALSEYSKMYGGKYGTTVKRWVKRAKKDWLDSETGLLVSALNENGTQIDGAPVKGSYSALNCSYLSYIDEKFAKEQYETFKQHFWKNGLMISGFREYHDRWCALGFDIDAGPILFGLSPSGTAFAAGAVTYFEDHKIRKKILRTAEKAGHTLQWNNTRHYALADVALVGEAIMLAMRTHYPKQ